MYFKMAISKKKKNKNKKPKGYFDPLQDFYLIFTERPCRTPSDKTNNKESL